MKQNEPVTHDLVLVGGGHSHVDVLKSFGMRPQPGLRLTLITRDVHTPYSGMLPGLIAGHYTRDESHIDLQPLARFAGARLYHTSATGIDFDQHLVHCHGRPPVGFDTLSIDIGSTPNRSAIAGADVHAIPVKPVDLFLERRAEIERAVLANAGRFRLVVVGGGAGGVELSLSLRHRLAQLLEDNGIDAAGLSVTVVSNAAEPLPNHSPAVRKTMRGFMQSRGVELRTGENVVAFEADRLRCESGAEIEFDAAILATHAGAAAWLRETGLALNDAGFIRVDDSLQSISHAGVFAAGDIAAIEGRTLPKAGVYAVRQGPVLARNLRLAAAGEALQPYRPQPRFLSLISSGDRNAVASYGNLALEGRWVWRWKDWIDRRWMRKYQELPQMDAGDVDGDAAATDMRCGGCGAKVASPVLRRVLERLRVETHGDVTIGLDAPDDAAVIAVPAGKLLVQSVDQFRAFVDDPYLFGRITANHALGDLYAMGATPQTAQALVTLPFGPEAKIEQDLYQLLAGAVQTLDEAGCALIGGHTGEGAEMVFGLTVNGLASSEALLRKGGLRDGDALILTKPLGTGTIFAADMRAQARSHWVDAALESMLLSNKSAVERLSAHGATACTDVTGFGLLGHLIEMLRASGMQAQLTLDTLPALPGAVELLADGIASSLQPANEAFAETLGGISNTHAAYPLLFDPQTAGGLLAGVPAANADACLADLHAAGFTSSAVIGGVRQAAGAAPTIELAAA